MFRASQLGCREAARHMKGLGLSIMQKTEREHWDVVENSGVLWGIWGSIRERSWEINNLRILRHKSTFKKYLVEGVWQILEHQQ